MPLAHVFISYAAVDRRRAAPIVDGLRACGLDVWWDQDLTAGADFRAEIDDRLTTASAVVVCWSGAASRSRWVLAEAEEGAQQRRLVPLRLDKAPSPREFGSIHTLDFTEWAGDVDAPSMQRLVHGIRELAGGEVQSSAGRWRLPAAAVALSVLYAALAIASISLIARFDGAIDPAHALIAFGLTAIVQLAGFVDLRTAGVVDPASLISRSWRYYRPAAIAALFVVILALATKPRDDPLDSLLYAGNVFVAGTTVIAALLGLVGLLRAMSRKLGRASV